MTIRNIWSINIDEALVVDKFRKHLGKNYEIFIPSSRQLKSIDLLYYNLLNNKSKTIQVKGSRTYDPNSKEIIRYGKGRAAWFTLSHQSIYKPENKIDFYIFVLHSLINHQIKKDIKIDYLVIPYQNFIKIVNKIEVPKTKKYQFFIWIDSNDKRTFIFKNKDKDIYDLSKYLNNWDLLK